MTGNGRFSTTYTFGAGQASSFQRFWFQIASLPMGSYPFSPSDSGRRYVLVGGHPAIPHHRRHRAHHRKRRGDALGLSEAPGVAMMNRRGMVRAHSHWRPRGGSGDLASVVRRCVASLAESAYWADARCGHARWAGGRRCRFSAGGLRPRPSAGDADGVARGFQRRRCDATAATCARGCFRRRSDRDGARGPRVLRHLLRERTGSLGARSADPASGATAAVEVRYWPARRLLHVRARPTRPTAGRPSRSCPAGRCPSPEADPARRRWRTPSVRRSSWRSQLR